MNSSCMPTAAAASWVMRSSGSGISAPLAVVGGQMLGRLGEQGRHAGHVRDARVPVVAVVLVSAVVGDRVRGDVVPAVQADAACGVAQKVEARVEESGDEGVSGDLHRQPPAHMLGGVQPRVVRASSTSDGIDRTAFVSSLARSAISTVSARSSMDTSARWLRSYRTVTERTAALISWPSISTRGFHGSPEMRTE